MDQFKYWWFRLQARVGKTVMAFAIALLLCLVVLSLVIVIVLYPMEIAYIAGVGMVIFCLVILTFGIRSLIPNDPRKEKDDSLQ